MSTSILVGDISKDRRRLYHHSQRMHILFCCVCLREGGRHSDDIWCDRQSGLLTRLTESKEKRISSESRDHQKKMYQESWSMKRIPYLLPNFCIAVSRVFSSPIKRLGWKGNPWESVSLFLLPWGYVKGATIWVKQVMMIGRSIIPNPTIKRVGMRERTSTLDPAWGDHMPYIGFSMPDNFAPLAPFIAAVWAWRVVFSSVMTSFKTVDSPTGDKTILNSFDQNNKMTIRNLLPPKFHPFLLLSADEEEYEE